MGFRGPDTGRPAVWWPRDSLLGATGALSPDVGDAHLCFPEWGRSAWDSESHAHPLPLTLLKTEATATVLVSFQDKHGCTEIGQGRILRATRACILAF